MNTLSPSTLYFAEYWQDLWSGISSERDLLTSFNPRVVIKELFDEITLNKQSNKANEDFFKRTLGEYSKTDPGSQKRLKLHLTMILKEFELFQSRPLYLPQLCRAALNLFDDLAYFEDSVSSLVDLTGLQEWSSRGREMVRMIANHLIVEFREIGYTDDEIRDFPRHIFSSIHYNAEGFPYWSFPRAENDKGQSDVDSTNNTKLDEYRKSLETAQSNLSERDRLQALLTLATRKKRSRRYIFRVNGMVGTNELHLGEVTFYPPAIRRFVVPGQMFDVNEELFRGRGDDDAINATIAVKAISASSGEVIARSKVEKALAICRRVMYGELQLWINKSYLALDDDGQICATRHSAFERPSEGTAAFSLTDEQIERSKKSVAAIEESRSVALSNGWGRRFDEACSWLRKAEESNAYVEKLLSYWICIETLCAKGEEDTQKWFEAKRGQAESSIYIIKEVVGKIRAVGKCYQHGWAVYWHLADLVALPSMAPQKIQISQELAAKAKFFKKEGERIFLGDFIDCCGDIAREIPEGLLKEQVSELHDFYSDKDVALGALKSHLRTTQDELAFIYRMRNKIAHDGSSEHPLLPSLCKLAGDYANSLFHRIGYYVVERKESSLDSILITAVQDYDRIELRLQTEKPMDVLLERM